MSDDPAPNPPDRDQRRAPSRLHPEALLLDQLTDQLERTRDLLTGSPEEAAERALNALGGQAEAEARIAADLATRVPLAQPARFLEAHRLTMGALEVLDREGSRNPPIPRLGPLRPLAEVAVEFVSDYIVQSFAKSVAGRLRTLYTRREVQCPRGTPERRMLAGARVEAERIATGFSGGGPAAPLLVAAGAAVPLLASVSQWLGAIDITSRLVLGAAVAALFVLFFVLSWVLLRGAAVAHRRSRLIMQRPLAALWETIGHAGNPPHDESVTFALVAVVLTATVWFVLPAVGAAVFVFA